jgi:hypothetical protein
MRWIPILAILPLLAACGTARQPTEQACPELPFFEYGIVVGVPNGQWAARGPVPVCGRVFERNIVSAIERDQFVDVTGIRCSAALGPLAFPYSLCLVRSTRGCELWGVVHGVTPKAFKGEAKSAPCRNLNLP